MSKTEHAIQSFEEEARGELHADHLREHERLAPYTTFRIGGPADVMYDATSAEDLANAVALARRIGVPHFVLGLGANILVGDRGFRGVVIRNCARAFHLSNVGILRAESGAVVGDLIA